jgi:hypothetical protein
MSVYMENEYRSGDATPDRSLTFITRSEHREFLKEKKSVS